MKTYSTKNGESSVPESSDKDPKKSVSRPDLVWRLMLKAFAAACILAAALSFYLYMEIKRENIFGAVNGEKDSLSTASREKLEQALEILRAQDAAGKALEKNPPAVADPSR